MENNPDHMVQDNATPRKRKRSPNSDLHPVTDRNTPIQENVTSQVYEQTATQSSSKRPREKSGSPKATEGSSRTLQVDRTHVFSLAELPVEILQRILCYLDPFCLGRMMRVNRRLYSLLDPQELYELSGSERHPHRLQPDTVWSCSRKAHLPSIPHPLASISELEMMRLIYGKRCQRCGNLPKALSTGSVATPWNLGPGPTGVRTIWPFRTRLCANCLRPSLVKESDLTQPGSPQLHLGLLPASFTPSLHYVMSITLTQTPVPAGLQLTKHFYRPQVDHLLQTAPEPLVTGGSDHEKWSQNLDAMRRQCVEDTVRLEAWELSLKAANDMLTIPSNTRFRSSASGSSVQSDNMTKSYFSTSSGGQRPYTTLSSRSGIDSSFMSAHLSRNDAVPQSYLSRTSEHVIVPSQSAAVRSAIPVPQFPTVKHTHYPVSDQGSVDVVRLKAERRAEIQARCMDLNPPIVPQILEQLPAFQTALQSLMPLDDRAWDRLKVQLLDQRNRSEHPGVPLSDSAPSPDRMDTASIWRDPTPIAEPVQIDYMQQALRPVREKLYEFAREYVHRRYAGGTGLTYSTAPQFAADVLLYVRQRFYENQGLEDAAFSSQNQKPPDEGPSGIRTRTLKLEHMRYVFDTSIKPFTEFVRKDLYLCSGCDTQGRHFAFEAIIQHYASKHTDSFSRGTAIVHWKSEWPAQPPFEPNPGNDGDPVVETATNLLAPEYSALVALSTSDYPPITQPHSYISYHDRGGSAANQDPRTSGQDGMDVEITHDGIQPTSAAEVPHDRLDYRAERSGRDINIDHHYRGGDAIVDENHSLSYPMTSLIEVRDFENGNHQREVLSVSRDFRRQARAGVNISTSELGPRHIEVHTRPRHLQPSPSPHYHREPPVLVGPSEMRRGKSYESNQYDRYRNTRSLFLPENSTTSRRRSPFPTRQHDNSSRYREIPPVDYQPLGRDVDWDHPVDVVPDLGRNTADRFLASFDIPANSQDFKSSPKPASTGRLSRPESRAETYSRDALVNRQSNTSYHRSRIHIPHGVASQTPISVTQEFRNQTLGRRSSFSGPSSLQQTRRHYTELVPIDQVPYPRNQIIRDLDDMRSVYTYNRHPMTDDRDHQEAHHDPSRPRYVDQYGREIDPRGLEIVRDPRSYQEVREVLLDRTYHHNDDWQHTRRHDQPQYGHEPMWNSEDRSSYTERTNQEYLPRPSYVQYERLPGREVFHANDPQHHPINQPRPHPDVERDRRYERR